MRSGPARDPSLPIRIGDRSAGTYIRAHVRTLHPSLHLGRHPQAVPAHVAGIERAAELQRLPYRHRQCRHLLPGRPHPSANALGPDSALVVEAAQGLDEAVHVQCASRDRDDEAVLPRSVQANPLHHPRVGLLRMAGHAGRQAAALLHAKSMAK